MGIPTLIKTLTASDSASLAFVHGASDVVFDSTYDEYMFVFSSIHLRHDTGKFSWQVNASGQSGYNETITSTSFRTNHSEADDLAELGYLTSADQAQGTAGQSINEASIDNADAAGSGILHLFSPSNTTYVKHFYSVFSDVAYDRANCVYAAGYVNVTAALIGIQFSSSGDNFDGVIQMYGIA